MHLRTICPKPVTDKRTPSPRELFSDDKGMQGVEYRTEVGIIDILAKGSDGAFYVLELKLGRGPDAGNWPNSSLYGLG